MIAPQETRTEGAPDWMVSYADMITILMSFFAVMFSLAVSKESNKDAPFKRSLHRQFGKFDGVAKTTHIPSGAAQMAQAAGGSPPQIDSTKLSPVGEFEPAGLIGPSDQATIGGVLYFDPGVRELTEAQQRQLETVAKALGGGLQKIEIVGHTLGQTHDAGGKLRESWNLAYARCDNTRHCLVSLGISPWRIRIGVAAQFQAPGADRDAAGFGKSDCVDVLMPNKDIAVGRAESNAKAMH